MRYSAKYLKYAAVDKENYSARALRPSLLAFAVAQALAAPVMAATIEVNNSGDTDPAAACTLRQAIVSANTNMIAPTSNCVAGTAADTLIFHNTVVASGTIPLTQASNLNITNRE